MIDAKFLYDLERMIDAAKIDILAAKERHQSIPGHKMFLEFEGICGALKLEAFNKCKELAKKYLVK